jgi:hypothetical protein
MIFFTLDIKGIYLAQIPPKISNTLQCKQRVEILNPSLTPITAVLERVIPREQILSYFSGPNTYIGNGWIETNRVEKDDLLVAQYYSQIIAPVGGDVVVDLAFRPLPSGNLAAKVDTRSSLPDYAQLLSNNLKNLFTQK